MISVEADGVRSSLIAFALHRLSIAPLCAGSHTIALPVFGDRYNSFGTLYNTNDEFQWYGPDSYWTIGSEWTVLYLLRDMGIITGPVLCRRPGSETAQRKPYRMYHDIDTPEIPLW